MKKSTLLILISIFILSFSCKNDDDDDDLSNSCSVSNPIEELGWLKERIEQLSDSNTDGYFYVSQNTLNGETVFIFPDCCPVCDTVTLVYDCQGNNIGSVGDENISISILDDDIIIWKPNNFACS